MPLRIAKSRIEDDPALSRSDPGARGDRKILVTELWPKGERLADVDDVDWIPPVLGGLAPVLQVDGLEFAVFTEAASQDRHRHKAAYEIYTILEGCCLIEVSGNPHRLEAGDSLVVLPGECHEVLASKEPFLAQVVVAPAGGPGDKISCDPDAG